jgi:hypothetical protein
MFSPSKEQMYIPARKSMTTFAVITVILLVLTIVIACMCMYNFDRGLAQYVDTGSRFHRNNRKQDRPFIDDDTKTPNAYQAQTNRMTIE